MLGGNKTEVPTALHKKEAGALCLWCRTAPAVHCTLPQVLTVPRLDPRLTTALTTLPRVQKDLRVWAHTHMHTHTLTGRDAHAGQPPLPVSPAGQGPQLVLRARLGP